LNSQLSMVYAIKNPTAIAITERIRRVRNSVRCSSSGMRSSSPLSDELPAPFGSYSGTVRANYACGGGSAEADSWPVAASLMSFDQGVVMGLLCGRSGIYGGSSIAPLSSRTIVLLASRNSRRTLPAVRITSGRRSGGITIRATINNSNISTMLKYPHLQAGHIQ